MVIVVCGPGGVGKGTVVARLVAEDPSLWLSRSWTTRERRPGESADAYVFVDRPTFESAIAEGRFLEHAEFLGNLYGTPWPETDAGSDVVLEIEVQGAAQVLERVPEALVILLEPPSAEVQAARMVQRGDAPERIEERVAVAAAEVAEGRRLGGVSVVNDDLDTTIAEVRAIIEGRRGEGTVGGVGPRGTLRGPFGRVPVRIPPFATAPSAPDEGAPVAQIHDSMINPRIETLLSKVDSRFSLVSLGAQRARQINAYFNQLGDGQGSNVPPQVTSLARKPLSIAFEEIAVDKIVPVRIEAVEVVDETDETIALVEAVEGDADPAVED